MLVIRQIQPEMTYKLRHLVLRPNQSIEESMYESDFKQDTFHVGAFYNENLISVASFIVDRHVDFSIERQYRLRQMATLEDFRKLGAGREIVKHAEDLIKTQGINFIWCKGRTSVIGYYRKLGFMEYGEVFDYPPIGPHIIMFKHLG